MELSIKQVYQPTIRSVFNDRLHLNVTPQIRGKIYQPSLLVLPNKTTKLVKRKTQKSKKSKKIKKSGKRKSKRKSNKKKKW